MGADKNADKKVSDQQQRYRGAPLRTTEDGRLHRESPHK
jgi:hypothetical protein